MGFPLSPVSLLYCHRAVVAIQYYAYTFPICNRMISNLRLEINLYIMYLRTLLVRLDRQAKSIITLGMISFNTH